MTTGTLFIDLQFLLVFYVTQSSDSVERIISPSFVNKGQFHECRLRLVEETRGYLAFALRGILHIPSCFLASSIDAHALLMMVNTGQWFGSYKWL
jgi:hypothetical protein